MTQPEILYEDAQLIVCYKPAGIATQTKKLGQKDMVSILLNHIAQEGTGQPFIGTAYGRKNFCGSYRSCHRGNAAGLDAV